MRKNLGLMFILIFLSSCQLSTSKTTITTDSKEKKLKTKITFSGEINNGICINCSQ